MTTRSSALERRQREEQERQEVVERAAEEKALSERRGPSAPSCTRSPSARARQQQVIFLGRLDDFRQFGDGGGPF